MIISCPDGSVIEIDPNDFIKYHEDEVFSKIEHLACLVIYNKEALKLLTEITKHLAEASKMRANLVEEQLDLLKHSECDNEKD